MCSRAQTSVSPTAASHHCSWKFCICLPYHWTSAGIESACRASSDVDAEEAQILLPEPRFQFTAFVGVDRCDHLLDAARGDARADLARLVCFEHRDQQCG